MEFRRGRGGEAQRASRGEQAEGSKPSACSVSSWKRRRETHKDTAISRLMATKLNGTKLNKCERNKPTGLSLLVEKPSRRRELAVYVIPRALQTAINARPRLARAWAEGGGDVSFGQSER